MILLNEPMSSKRYKLACVSAKSDQSLGWMLYTKCSQGSKVSSGIKLRLIRLYGCTDRLDSSLYANANLYLMLDSSSFKKYLESVNELLRVISNNVAF